MADAFRKWVGIPRQTYFIEMVCARELHGLHCHFCCLLSGLRICVTQRFQIFLIYTSLFLFLFNFLIRLQYFSFEFCNQILNFFSKQIFLRRSFKTFPSNLGSITEMVYLLLRTTVISKRNGNNLSAIDPTHLSLSKM